MLWNHWIKIGNLAIHLSHSVQILELTHGYEEYFRARVALLDAYSDRLDEVSLPHPDITIEEEGLKSSFSGWFAICSAIVNGNMLLLPTQ